MIVAQFLRENPPSLIERICGHFLVVWNTQNKKTVGFGARARKKHKILKIQDWSTVMSQRIWLRFANRLNKPNNSTEEKKMAGNAMIFLVW